MTKIVLRLAVGLAADDDARGEDSDVASVLARHALDLFDFRDGLGRLVTLDGIEHRVAITHRIVDADFRMSGVHQHGPRAAVGFGMRAAALDLDVAAIEIEIVLRAPEPADRVDPFLRIGVALIVLAHRGAEHAEFVLVPAAHNVEPEPSAAHVIDRDHLLGGQHGMQQRRMHGREGRDALGLRQQARSPGQRLEVRAFVIGRAVAAPSAEGQQEVEPEGIRHLRKPQIVLPISGPDLVDQRRHTPGRAVRPEQTKFQPVVAVKGCARLEARA